MKMEAIERTWISSEVKLEENSAQEAQEDEAGTQRVEMPTFAPVFPFCPVQSMLLSYGMVNPMGMMVNPLGWMNPDNAFPPQNGNGQLR